MNDLNAKFAEHVTLVAFNLNLTKPMVVALCAVANTEESNSKRYGYFRALGMRSTEIAAGVALEKRGLVCSPDPKWPGHYALTEAGQHVFALLEIAGLVTRVNNELEKAS